MKQLLINNDHKALANIGTKTHAQIDTHITGTGADHSYIDQNVTAGATPQFRKVGIGAASLSNVDLNVAGNVTSANNSFGLYMGALVLTPTSWWNAFFQYVGDRKSVV